MDKQYNFNNIRTLLTEAFTAEELRRLCFDETKFRPVYDELSQGMGKTTIVDLLLEYANKNLLMETLLALAKKHNPARYERHKPYEVTPGPIPVSGAQGPALTELRDALAVLYLDIDSSRRVVADAGLNPQLISFSSRAITNWQAILEEAQNQDKVEALIQVAMRDYPTNQKLLQVRQAYLEWAAQDKESAAGKLNAGQSGQRLRQISSRQRMQLVDALLQCQSISHRQTRDTLVNDLPDEIKYNIQRSANDRVDVVNIVITALNYSSGLEELIELVRMYEGSSLGLQGVEGLLATMG